MEVGNGCMYGLCMQRVFASRSKDSKRERGGKGTAMTTGMGGNKMEICL